MKKIKIENLKNLKKVIEDLNAPKTYEFEGEKETFENPFDFVVEERNDLYQGAIAIYDRNEEYNIDYEENMSCLLERSFTDNIRPKLEEAIRKDLNDKDAYLEQYDSVLMTIAF